MSVLLQDGRRIGHLGWATQAIQLGIADGVFVSPFHTPRVGIPRHPAGERVVEDVQAASGEALFDANTHARLLPTSNNLQHYDTWQLWGPSGIGLDTDPRRLEHLERVFTRQDGLGVAPLAPTLTLDSPVGTDAQHAFRTAQLARGLARRTGQSIAGRRAFWRGGSYLDAYIGQLAALRSPLWVLTMVNDAVLDNQPEMQDTAAFEGFLRTVHSLSLRSRVIIAHADYAGVPAVAAGADTIGSGWDRAMRYFDPRSFQITSSGPQIPASYVTQGRLAAVLRRDAGDAISRLDPTRAARIRGGPMPADDTAERIHHLTQLHQLVDAMDRLGPNRQARVDALRTVYTDAEAEFSWLRAHLPRQTIGEPLQRRWNTEPRAALEAYAVAEGL